jgi:hypothetical protein
MERAALLVQAVVAQEEVLQLLVAMEPKTLAVVGVAEDMVRAGRQQVVRVVPALLS